MNKIEERGNRRLISIPLLSMHTTITIGDTKSWLPEDFSSRSRVLDGVSVLIPFRSTPWLEDIEATSYNHRPDHHFHSNHNDKTQLKSHVHTECAREVHAHHHEANARVEFHPQMHRLISVLLAIRPSPLPRLRIAAQWEELAKYFLKIPISQAANSWNSTHNSLDSKRIQAGWVGQVFLWDEDVVEELHAHHEAVLSRALDATAQHFASLWEERKRKWSQRAAIRFDGDRARGIPMKGRKTTRRAFTVSTDAPSPWM